MIIKSMSRKEPSFDQLASYMSSEKSDETYDLHNNCFSRSHDDLVEEFLVNSKLLYKRKNGNYLYHEIVSILVKQGLDQARAKRDLRDIAERYITERCPRNMVYGCLHEDHDHNLHYHLMISANERGERSRLRLTQKQFDTAKRNLETHVLEAYPHLEQPQLITAETITEKISLKAGEMKRRTGAMPIRDEIKKTIQEAMVQTNSMHNFSFFLSERGYQFYTRGKNFGVEVQHEDGTSKKYRFSTLGIHEQFQNFHDDLEAKASQELYSDDVRASELKNTMSARPNETEVSPEQNTGEQETLETSNNTDHTARDEVGTSEKEMLREKMKYVRAQEKGKQDDDSGGNNI
jgi:hypothetical protein